MLSVRTMVLPTDLLSSSNGHLFPSQLAPIYLPGIGMGTLHPLAVRVFNMLHWAGLAETGQVMTATSNADDYRSYDMQLQVFLQRYTPNYIPLRNVLSDRRMGPDGKMWYKRILVAAVATPGKSNHGWALALDGALWVLDDKTGRWSIRGYVTNKLFFAWLSAPGWFAEDHPWHLGTGSNAESFGLSWEMQSETWHLRYVEGDNVPRRVLDMEAYMGIAA